MADNLRITAIAVTFFCLFAAFAAIIGANSSLSINLDRAMAAKADRVSEYAPTAGAATELDTEIDDHYYIPTAGVETRLQQIQKNIFFEM